MPQITVLGAGLAGCEAALVAARAGCSVTLIDGKPAAMTPAHRSPLFAELVCSNSLRSNDPTVAVGLLKEELRHLRSPLLAAADAAALPAGSALAVDREVFSRAVTEMISRDPAITVVSEEASEIPARGVVVVATGPLTSAPLAAFLEKNICRGRAPLHFYDAVAPIVAGDSINREVAFFASRYGKGEGDAYLNCPMDRACYDTFYDALVHAETAPLHEVDAPDGALPVFEGCMPVEVMAARGRDTLRFGPMKPVGLPLPATGRDAYAVVQLRREDAEGEGRMFNLVGFQTRLTFSAQREVFRLIPGLTHAEFLRYGVMHRNTYLPSPDLLSNIYSLRGEERIFFAGQLTGVEGYVESISSGHVAGLNAARLARGLPPLPFPPTTVTGALARYVSGGSGTGRFDPMNANFGIVEPLPERVGGGRRARNAALAQRALADIDALAREEGS